MTNAERVGAFINECFDMHKINIREYFYYDFDGETYEEISWGGEEVDIKAVEYACELLGIDLEDALSLNENVITKWWEKYPYFKYITEYNYQYKKTFYGDGYENMRLLEAIFDVKLQDKYPLRYDTEDVKKRLKSELEEIGEKLPSVYHEGEEIEKFEMWVANFCDFEHIVEMTESFIEMIKNAKTLFLKAVKEGLSNAERQEYNFLVTVLGLRDVCYSSGYLRYDELIQVKDTYSALDEENFFNVIMFKHVLKFQPWRCKHFIKNEELVRKYLKMVPNAKGKMWEFAVAVSQFRCEFIWTDEDEETAERTVCYVKKTKDELAGDGEVADELMSYCRPAKKGGISVQMPKFEFHRILQLSGKVLKNNYMERWIENVQKMGGDIHE